MGDSTIKNIMYAGVFFSLGYWFAGGCEYQDKYNTDRERLPATRMEERIGELESKLDQYRSRLGGDLNGRK